MLVLKTHNAGAPFKDKDISIRQIKVEIKAAMQGWKLVSAVDTEWYQP